MEDKKYRILKHKISENTWRKKRTRTLIQAGGLLEKSGLLSALDLTPGDDLQRDLDALPKAATLVGALLEIKNQLAQNHHHQKLLWQQRGKEGLEGWSRV